MHRSSEMALLDSEFNIYRIKNYKKLDRKCHKLIQNQRLSQFGFVYVAQYSSPVGQL